MVQSNCFIELDRGPSTNPIEKMFNIRGLPQNIQGAQNLIRQKLEVNIIVIFIDFKIKYREEVFQVIHMEGRFNALSLSFY